MAGFIGVVFQTVVEALDERPPTGVMMGGNGEEKERWTPTEEELKEILEQHKQWVESAGQEGEQANLQKTNLQEANLQAANLWGADLQEANLAYVDEWQQIQNLSWANVYKVKNVPEGFMEWAVKNRAVCIADEKKWDKFRVKLNHTKEELRAAQKYCFPDKAEQGEAKE